MTVIRRHTQVRRLIEEYGQQCWARDIDQARMTLAQISALLGPDPAELGPRYEAGESLTQLAAATGFPMTTIRSTLLAAGVRMRPVGVVARNRKEVRHDAPAGLPGHA